MHQRLRSTGFYQKPGIFRHLLEFPCAPGTHKHWVLPNTWDFQTPPGVPLCTWDSGPLGFYQIPGIFKHLLEFPGGPGTQEHWVLPNTWDFQTPLEVPLCTWDSKALGFPDTSWSSPVHRRFKSIGFYQILGISRHLLEFPCAAAGTQEHWVLPNTWVFPHTGSGFRSSSPLPKALKQP